MYSPSSRSSSFLTDTQFETQTALRNHRCSGRATHVLCVAGHSSTCSVWQTTHPRALPQSFQGHIRTRACSWCNRFPRSTDRRDTAPLLWRLHLAWHWGAGRRRFWHGCRACHRKCGTAESTARGYASSRSPFSDPMK